VIWLLTRLFVWPAKASAGSVKLGYKTGRVFGYRRIFVFGLGVAVGLLLAPMTGAALREKIRSMIDGGIAPEPVPPATHRGDDEVVDLTMEVTS
jgi:hypothetical protein